ncbi:MAG TPA: 50S ribosomal protein L22 [Fimbriimonadaceae bacterium]|nr:50S ribosomal protein L22 [Fimbriimonadaceae bacterium]HRJ32091.1 50S ribosomal protein L22 [Fimbriimonadaceae bacterium]
MEVRAIAKKVRVQPRKVRIVAAEVKGKPASVTAHMLQFHPSKSAQSLRKVLISAIANAVNVHGLPEESLKIASVAVDQGPKYKRITQKAMGRGARIEKKTSHITVVLEDAASTGRPKPHGTKAKARPKFEAPKKAKKAAAPVEEVKAEEPIVEEATAEATEAPEQAPEAVETTNSAPEAPAEEATEEKKD